MELKKFVKEVMDVLEKAGAVKASFGLHLNLENEKVEVSPYGSEINFKIIINKKEKK